MEDYLMAIGKICRSAGIERATTGEIARVIGVSNGTVSDTLKELASRGLINHIPYSGPCLTEEGIRRGRRVEHRSRVLEQFLTKTLGVPAEAVTPTAAGKASSTCGCWRSNLPLPG